MDALNVLIVEDTPMAQKFCKKLVGGFPHTSIDVAGDGQEGLKKFIAGEFQLIFMDIGLPILNGIEATRAIRQYEKENNLPAAVIVALTANEQANIKDDCFLAGMNDYLSKPFSAEKCQHVWDRFFKKI